MGRQPVACGSKVRLGSVHAANFRRIWFFAAVCLLTLSSEAGVARAATSAQPASVSCTVTGTTSNDVLIGTKGNDVICGLGGDDTIYGMGGNDVLLGGDGNDTLIGGPGNDKVDGGPGSDTFSLADTSAKTKASLWTGQSTGNGNDTMFAIENLTGGSGGDLLTGDDANNVLNGGAGNDVIDGREGNDQLLGGSGEDSASFASSIGRVSADLNSGLASGAGSDAMGGIEDLLGGKGGDTLVGGPGSNVLVGGAGNDRLQDQQGTNSFQGGTGTNICSVEASDTATGCTINSIGSHRGMSFRGKKFLSVDLSNMDFSGADFTGAYFANAIARNANFSGSNFQRAQVGGSRGDFSGTDFSGADLSGATLDQASTQMGFTGASFNGVQKMDKAKLWLGSVAGADFSGAIFAGADLSWYGSPLDEHASVSTKFIGADFRRATDYNGGPGFSNCDLSGANVSGFDLSGSTIWNCNVSSVNLGEVANTCASCAGWGPLGGVLSYGITGFPASMPWGYALRGGFIVGPGVSLVNTPQLNLASNPFVGLDLHGLDLTGVSFWGANLSGANFSGSTLGCNNPNVHILPPPGFALANLQGANFTNADLSGCTFWGANLNGVNVQGAHLAGAKITSVQFQACDLSVLGSRSDAPHGVMGTPASLPGTGWTLSDGVLTAGDPAYVGDRDYSLSCQGWWPPPIPVS